MQKISDYWKEINDELDKINTVLPHLENNISIRRVLGGADWVNVADQFIKDAEIKEGDNVLEIGGGIGLLCEEFKKQKEVNYSLLDTPSMLRIAKKHLSDRDVKCDFYEELPDKKFDLLIAINCLSEMPREYVEYLLGNAKCKSAAIIDGDPQGDFDQWLEKILHNNFKSVVKWNNYAIHGTDNQSYYLCKNV